MPTHLTKLLSVLIENGIIHDESFAIQRRFEVNQKEPVGELIVKIHPKDRLAAYGAFERLVARYCQAIE